MKIKKLTLNNFMAFENAEINWSDNINIICGENSTGKTTLLKVMYSLIKPLSSGGKENLTKEMEEQAFVKKIQGVFRPDEMKIGRLVSRKQGSNRTDFSIDLEKKQKISVGFGNRQENHADVSIIQEEKTKKYDVIYIPTKEMISTVEHFVSLYDEYHIDFEEMYYDKGKMVLHVGGATGGKEAGMERFIHNFSTYPERVKNKVILENDDKTYTAAETLKLCKALNIPMVLDVHHHNCNNNGENINDIWAEIVNTWNNQPLPPKIHFSSPREGKFDRKHADYINSEEFMKFINSAKELHRDFDVMLECKEKDIALFKLVDDIKEYYHWIDETTFEV